MSAPPPAFVLFLIATACLCFFLASWAWQRRRMEGATELALILLSSAVYAAAYSFAVSRADLPGILLAVRFEYLGIATVGPFNLAFAWRFTKGKRLPLPLGIALAVVAGFIIALVWTADRHGLFYRDMAVSTDGPFPMFSFTRGPLYFLNYAFVEVTAMSAAVMLIASAFRPDRVKRRQAIVIAAGSLLPLLTALAYLFRLTPKGFDLNPIAISGSGVLCSIALFKLGLVEIVPAARELALDSLSEGFIVVDDHGRLLDSNPAGLALLEIGDGAEGLSLATETEAGRALWAQRGRSFGQTEFTIDRGAEGKRHLVSKAYPIKTVRGGRGGTAFLVSDITELVERSRQVEELNRDLERRVEAAVAEIKDQEVLLGLHARESEMGRMMGFIIHQWRQNLYAVSLYLDGLRASVAGLPPRNGARLAAPIEGIGKFVETMSETIDDFKSFIEPGRITEIFSPAVVVGETLNLMQDLFNAHGIAVGLRLDGTVRIPGFPNELKQVLISIINNSYEVFASRKPAFPCIYS